jgi:hypothetical protein
MSIITSQQISRYYDAYRDVDVTFTKEVIRTILLNPKQVFLKCIGYQWPCVIYSASMTGAKVIVNLKESFQDAVRKANNIVSLRFSFIQPDKNDPLSFHVQSKITGYTPYGESHPEMNFLALSFTQRPPDGLIEILGSLLEANVAAKKRKEERVTVTADVIKKLQLRARETVLTVDGVPRKGIIRDISFGGAKIIIAGVAQFLVNKDATLEITADDPPSTMEIPGKIVRFEAVEGRQDIAAVAMEFNEKKVPMKFKLLLNGYLKQEKKTISKDT